MWQLLGTLAISAFGGTFLLHYLKNFILKETYAFSWDGDGLIERTLITYIIVAAYHLLYLIPFIITVKIIFRLSLIGYLGSLIKISEPGVASQKVRLKADLAFDLLLSPAFAILVGVIF